MISKRTLLLCLAFFVVQFVFAGIAVAAVPVESSHYNSNTFANPNTLTSTGTVTFTIAYDAAGDIKWYKDNVLAQTDVACTSATVTTAWTVGDYGQVKQLKVNSTNVDGTSIDTVWNVEVQEMGTAAVEECPLYPTYTLRGYKTIKCTNGWANIPTMYLKTRKPDWLAYVSSGTYIADANIAINTNAVLRADDGSARELRMRCLPLGHDYPGVVEAANGGSIYMDSMTIVGWDIDHSSECTRDIQSAVIDVAENSTLILKNSTLRWAYVHFIGTKNAVVELDHNEFIGGNPYGLDLWWLENSTVTNNSFRYAQSNLLWCRGLHNIIRNNTFCGMNNPGGSDLILGDFSTAVGNEFTYAGWNQIEAYKNVLCRDNVLHDSGGNHNGINAMWYNTYSVNDYCYDFPGFSGWYSQLEESPLAVVPPENYNSYAYIFNGRAKNVPTGFCFYGGHHCYIYNFTCEQSAGEVRYSADDFYVRRSSFSGTRLASDFGFYVMDYCPDHYGYVGTVTVMDSVFSGINGSDFGFIPSGNALVNIINCFRKEAGGTPVLPTKYFYTGNVRDWANPEQRHYVWLDVLVKDINGRLVNGANVTVENLTDPAMAPLQVTLPPPPPDLWEVPVTPLPQPALASFSRLRTLSTGKLPGPNYGWSANAEPSPALLFRRVVVDRTSIYDQGVKAITDYQYRIKASYHGLEASAVVLPDTSWYREDPTVPAHTVELTLNGDSTAGTDTTPPVLTITAPKNNTPVNGTTCITAIASDNWDIDRMEIFIDNVARAVISADSCAWTADAYSCSWDWDTAGENDGSHVIRVIACDSSGNSTERTVTVQVLTKAAGSSNDVIVYPNPYIKGKSQGAGCIFANLGPGAVVRVYTISGEPVTTLTADTAVDRASVEWDVSHIGGGVYLYTVQSPDGTTKGKVGIVK